MREFELDAQRTSTEATTLSQDAAIVLALAETAVPFASSFEDEAERWVRVLRMHGTVGASLQALGVGEAPLETTAAPHAVRLLRSRDAEADVVETVQSCARSFARQRGAGCVTTVDVLFGVIEVYGQTFDRALYIRGATRDELLERLMEAGSSVPAPYDGSTV
jgi:hypothetical protein